MKKVYSFIVSLLLASVFTAYSQDGKHCYTDEVYREAVTKNPGIIQEEQQKDEFTRNFIQQQNAANHRGASTVYIIPVVFHVIHQYGAENISDAQIIDAINVMNRDYRKLNSDTSAIINDFKALAADCEIEFRLAKLDPNGNCTNGIDRIESYKTQIGSDAAKYNGWPREMYLNIWTVAKFGKGHEEAAAYAYKPSSFTNDSIDGVISLSNYVGSIGTSNFNNSRTLTHEVGHVLNLNHPWGATNKPGVACGDDGVGDTPLTKGWDVCPGSNFDVCNAGINENFQNFMEYSYCDHMFTYGQKARMVAALNNFGLSGAGRSNLWQQANLVATGTDGSPGQLCAPVADFYTTRNHICAGASVQYFSASFNTDSFNYDWSFPLGNPSTSTARNPIVTYSTPGVYNASLRVYNSAGMDSISKTETVTVSGPATLSSDYVDSFETAANFPGDGYLINDYGITWDRVTNAGYSGTACLKMDNYSSGQAGLSDSYVTPALNLFGQYNPTLTFRLSYALKDNVNVDALEIYTSFNCGETWTQRGSYSSAQLVTATHVGLGGFTPTSQSQWGLFSVNVVTIRNQPNVRIKFRFVAASTNNLYLDDINIQADPTGIEEANMEALSFEVYPNPTKDAFNISFEMLKSDRADVKIFDMLGRETATVVNMPLRAGEHQYHVSTTDFNKGIYFVRLNTGDISVVKKLVIE